MSDERRELEPFDRLTHMANEMIEDLPEDVQAIVLLTDGDWNGGVLAGWETDIDAVAHMIQHLKAIFKTNGTTMSIMTEDGAIL